MSEINLNDVTSGYNLVKINNNFQTLERVINEELLHRVNADNIPNNLQTDIDANSRHIYNLGKPTTGGEPIRVKDLFGDPGDLLGGPTIEHITTVAGQTVITLSTSYVVGSNSVYVFHNGEFLIKDTDYTETSTTSITIINRTVDAGDIISFVPVVVVSGDGGSSNVSAANIGTGAGVFSQKSGDTILLKSIKAGSGVTVTSNDNEITVSSEASTVNGVNIGATGEGVFASKDGTNLQFKKIRAGANVTVTSDTTGVTIASTGGGGGGGSDIAIYDNGVLKTSTATSLNFVNNTVALSGTDVTVRAFSPTYLNVKDYGAVGDGVTNDSSAVQSAITAAKTSNKSVFFPDGTYIISSLGTQSGRVFLIGTGNSVLKGTFTYFDGTFPLSADTNTPLTPTSPYFAAHNMSFESTSSDYGLKLSTIQQPGFLSTFSLIDCRFYGNKGVLAQHMIGFELTNCEFNNKVAGMRIEGCVNGLFTACRWQNQAETGVFITGHPTEGNRAGGENMRFVNCEWAVCTYGIIANEHMWLTLDSCLLDYCDVPLFLSGANWSKAINTYFGASNVASSRFSSVTGYLAPNINGCAVYGRPSGTPIGNRVVGFTAHNCEFINYMSGSSQPIVYIDGYVNGTYPMSAEEVSFTDCLFYATTSHNAPSLLEISNTKIARVTTNRFRSYNVSTSMSNAYRTYNVMDWQNHSNSFWNCTQSGSQVRSAYESAAGLVISATEPVSVYPGLIWVQP